MRPHLLVITVLLSGGIGNQMFQYATGRALQLRRRDRLRLDLSFLLDKRMHEVYREYALDIFAANPRLTVASRIFKIMPALIGLPGRRRCERLFQPPGLLPIDERSFRYDPNLFEATSPNVYLNGYWQSPKYFEGAAPVIRDDFSFRRPLSASGRSFASAIRAVNSVGVHVRRGDYVSVLSAIEGHGFAGIDYYRRGIDYLRERLDDLHLFVVSDDLDWCKRNLSQFDMPVTFIDHSPGRMKFADDMNLLSQCKHFVISNSSFGWWGAWLSQNPGKIVVCPKRWCRDPALEPEDIVPDTWIRL